MEMQGKKSASALVGLAILITGCGGGGGDGDGPDGTSSQPVSGNFNRVGFATDSGTGSVELRFENHSFGGITVTTDPAFDPAGAEGRETSIERIWTFSGDSVSDRTFNFSDDTVTIPNSEPSVPMTINDDGTLQIDRADGMARGAYSSDGDRFVAAGVGDFPQIAVHGAEWSPGDISQEFNMVILEGFTDESDRNSEPDSFRDGQAGLYGAALDGLVECSAGSCTVHYGTVDTIAQDAIYAQMGGDSVNVGQCCIGRSVQDFATVTETGRLVRDAGGADDFWDGGFIAPDAEMFAMQIGAPGSTGDGRGDSQRDFPFRDTYIGLPKGSACTNETLNGTYNAVSFANRFADQNSAGNVDAKISTESAVLEVTFNGEGDASVTEVDRQVFEVEFGAGSPTTNSDSGSGGASFSESYSVQSDCKVIVENGTNRHALGAVSPDGESFVLMDITSDGDLDGFSEGPSQVTFAEFAYVVGFRAP